MQIRNLNNPGALLMAILFLSIVFYSASFAINSEEMDDYFCNEIKKPFFKVSGKNEAGEIIVPGRSQGRDFNFMMPKPVGKKRIFIVGESVAALMYWPGCSFVNEFISNPEVINCGMGAYDSGRILDVLTEAMEYQPDLMIVLSGNNEMAMDSCRGLSAEMRRRIRRIRINARKIFAGRKEKEAEHFVNIKIHEERLRKMAETAKKKNVPLVLCTLPANMSEYPPSGHLPFRIKNFMKAFFLTEAGAFKKAEKIFKTILVKEPRESFAHFYLARTLEKLNKFKEAKEHYQLAIEWDNRFDRVSKERNEMIRKVAKEEGACLADLEKSFMRVSENGIIGGDYIVDGVHWFGKYNDFVILETLKYASECKGAGGIVKKHETLKLKEMEASDFKKNRSDNKKEVLDIFHYAIAFMSDDREGGEINERTLMMFDRVYSLDKNFIMKVSKSKDILKKYIKENFWTEIRGPILVDSWYSDFLHHLAELFRRNGEFKRANENIEKALSLMPERARFSLTKRLIIEGMKKNSTPKDLIKTVAAYNRGKSEEAKIKSKTGEDELQNEKSKLYFERSNFKEERHKLKDKKREEEKYIELSDIPYIKESKKIADKAIEMYMAGDIKGAKLDFEKAIKLNPGNIEAQITMCSISSLQKDFDVALEYCDMAAKMAETPVKHVISIPGMLSDILLIRAEIYGNMKEYEKATLDLNKALEKAPVDWSDFKKVEKKIKQFK